MSSEKFRGIRVDGTRTSRFGRWSEVSSSSKKRCRSRSSDEESGNWRSGESGVRPWRRAARLSSAHRFSDDEGRTSCHSHSSRKRRRSRSSVRGSDKKSESWTSGDSGVIPWSSPGPLSLDQPSPVSAHSSSIDEGRSSNASRKRKSDQDDSEHLWKKLRSSEVTSQPESQPPSSVMEPPSNEPAHDQTKPKVHDIGELPYVQGYKLGEGGFGSVYAGTRKSDGLQVAIKYVPKDSIFKVQDPEAKGQDPLSLEVALMLRVNSAPACPNIVRLIEWFEQPDYYVMILERPDLCEDLKDFSQYSAIDEDVAKRLTLQLINALKHCESRGVLHRDVKPENILICTDTQEIKLLDFGCGDFLKDSAYTFFSGTQLYAPPEWFITRRYHARPATVWSVGVTLLEILLGDFLFNSIEEITENQLYIPRFLSEECQDLIRWCLTIDPDDRPSLEEIERHPWFQ